MQYSTRLTMLFVLLVIALGAWAVPARRVAIMVDQPDGTKLVLTMRGDEHFHCLVTADGVPVVQHEDAYYYAHFTDEGVEPTTYLAHEAQQRTAEEKSFVESLPEIQHVRSERMQRVAARRNAAEGTGPEVPTTGEVKVPVMLVQYADVKFSSADPTATFEARVNGENFTDEGGYGSIREYFVDQSGGQFVPHFDVIGPITLDHAMSYYGGNNDEGSDLRPREMVSEACSKAYSELKTDFSQYDNNGDGYVDIVYVIYAGYGEASYPDMLENTIWPHQWQLETPLTLGGVKVNRYACNNELDGHEGHVIDGIGTFCHEFSHCLGLPDFYDTGAEGTAFGMHVWSIMDYGCYNNNGHTPCAYTAYEKDYLGWISLKELSSPTNVTLKPLSEGGEAYKIVNEMNPDEYYVVEYCKKAGWNAYAPAEGMLIMHVDYLALAWQTNVVNNNPNHQRMTIIPADAKLSQQTLATDVWTGKDGHTELTATSTPAAKVNTGGFMNKDISNIAMQNGKVTFSFMKGALEAPQLNEPNNVTQTGFTLNWTEVKDVEGYEVQLDRLVENPYLIKEDFDKMVKDNRDIGHMLDNYTREKGWNGKEVYGLDGAIRIGRSNEEGAIMTPYMECDSSMVTIVFTIRKGIPEGEDANMIMAIGDSEWGNRLWGHQLTVDDKVWGNYCLVIDSIGNNPFLYIDTRDNANTPQKESLAIEIDRLYVLPGNRADELTEVNVANSNHQTKHHIRPLSARAKAEWMMTPPTMDEVMRRSKNSDAKDEKYTKSVRYEEIPVCTARTKDNSLTFSELDGGLYRCRVRSVKDANASLYSNAVDVMLIDTLLPQTDIVPQMYIHRDSMYVKVPDSVAVYYTTDATHPTAYSIRYTGPFALEKKMTVKAMARRTGYRSSEVVDITNWFEFDGATYRVVSDVEPAVMLSDKMGGNDENSYSGHRIFGDEVKTDSLTYVLKGIDSHAFRNATALRSVSLQGDVMESVGDSLFHGCSALSAVVWDVDLPMANGSFDAKSYYNLLVYLPDTASLDNPLIENDRMYVIKGGKCRTMKLNADKPFYCPQPFVAEKVAYSRSFTQNTVIGSSAGWETLTLPFDVQRVDHTEKGRIVPFGVEGEYHFWLSTLDGQDFVPATEIKANVPYIIAMPNNSVYGEHGLGGMVTFAAEQAWVYATNGDLAIEGDRFALVPTYEKVVGADSIYALNLRDTYTAAETYAPGSVFVANKYMVQPFSAYVVPHSGNAAPMYRIAFEEDEQEDRVADFAVTVADGVVYISTPHDCVVTVRDMMGRQVRSMVCTAGVNEINSLAEGMYIIATTKVYVGH